MSRGPGRVERAIAQAFESHPRRYFVDELVAIVAKNGSPASRRSVLRAATNVAKRMGWTHRTEGRRNYGWEENQAIGRLTYFTPTDFSKTLLRNYRMANGRSAEPTPEELYSPERLARDAAREAELEAVRKRLANDYIQKFEQLKQRRTELEEELAEVESKMAVIVEMSATLGRVN